MGLAAAVRKWQEQRTAKRAKLTLIKGYAPDKSAKVDAVRSFSGIFLKFEHIDNARKTAQNYWGRIKSADDNYADYFRSELNEIHQQLNDLKASLNTNQQDLLQLNRKVLSLSERDIFQKLRKSLPNSLMQTIAELPSLAKKEKELTAHLSEHLSFLVKIVEKMLKVFEKERTKVFNFVGELEAELSAYPQKKEEITKTVEELEEVKKSIELMERKIDSAIPRYFLDKREEIKLLYGQLILSTSFYCTPIVGSSLVNPIYHKHSLIDRKSKIGSWKHAQKTMNISAAVINSFSPEKISQLKAILSKSDEIGRLLRKHRFLGDYVEHFLRDFSNFRGTVKKNIKPSGFDFERFLRYRWVTHMTIPFQDSEGAIPKVFPFFSMLFSGKICSAKYLSDNQQKFFARSGQAQKHGDAYTIAFSVGAEIQYGDYGFLFNALDLVENSSFYYRGSTQGTLFDELHALDLRFNPNFKNSPGAVVDITKGYALIPNVIGPYLKSKLEDYRYVLTSPLEDLQRGHVQLAPVYDPKRVQELDWSEKLSPQVSSFLKDKVIFYDMKRFVEIKEKIKKDDKFLVNMFGFYLLRSLKNKLASRAKKNGRIVIMGEIKGFGILSSPTYQGDYSGPIFAYITDPELLKRTEQEIERKSQFNEFVAKANAFLDNLNRDLSAFNE